MKKRILTVFIALTMLIAMTGCGSRQEQNTSSDPATGEAAARTTETDKASDSYVSFPVGPLLLLRNMHFLLSMHREISKNFCFQNI